MNDNSDPQVRFSVLLVAEGTYPYRFGGVSTWCHSLVGSLPEVRFYLRSITDHPLLSKRFVLPPNVIEHVDRPIWGVRYVGDAKHAGPTRVRFRRKERRAAVALFLPSYRTFLESIFGPALEPEQCGEAVHAMYRHFATYGFDAIMRSHEVWRETHDRLTAFMRDLGPAFGAEPDEPTMTDVTTVTTWLRHWLLVLADPIPKTNIVQSAMAGLCTLVSVAAKREHGARYVLTEHGVYLREVYLAESREEPDLLKLVRIRWARRLTELSYAAADQISPCCDFNQRWELHNGADPAKLRTIYYGVDASTFTPQVRPPNETPVVVWAARINPLKDVETLLRAAALVVEERPGVKFHLYGTAAEEDRAYERSCLRLWQALELGDHVEFRGYTDRVQDAYNDADIVVLPSISEGFPNTTLEAMLCGKPVVATAVGGLPEQLSGVGITVEPRNPIQLADAILALLEDDATRVRLGEAARERATSRFTLERLHDEHVEAYRRLVGGEGPQAKRGAPAGEAVVRVTRREAPVAVPAGAGSAGNAFAAPLTRRAIVIDVDNRADWSPPVPAYSLAENRWALLDEVASHATAPADALEVAAVIESLGTNDHLARSRYGASDVFDLAGTVLADLRDHRATASTPVDPDDEMLEAAKTRRDVRRARGHGVVALVASALVLLAIQFARIFGDWASMETIAFAVGISTGMATGNGFVLAISRPLSFYLASGDGTLVGETVRRTMPVFASVSAVVGIVAVGAAAAVGASGGALAVMAVGFAITTLLWFTLGLVLLLGTGVLEALLPACAGLAAFVAADRLFEPVSSIHLGLAAAVAFAVAALLAGVVLSRALPPEPEHGPTRAISLAATMRDGVPFFLVGLFAAVPIMLPHVAIWIGRGHGGPGWSKAMVALELGLTLALAPLLISIGKADLAVRRFWVEATEVLDSTPADRGDVAVDRLSSEVRATRTRYMTVLAILSLLALGVMDLAIALGWFDHAIASDQEGWLFAAFAAAIGAYLLFGWGTFSNMYAVSLGRPRAALVPLLGAVAVLVVVGLPLALAWTFRSVIAALFLSTVVYAALSTRATRQALEDSTHLYTTIS